MKPVKRIAALAAALLLYSHLALGQQHAGHEGRHESMDEASMTHVLITHEVDDAEHWLAAWRGEDSRHKLFTDNGAAHVHTFQDANNPNLTGLVVLVADMDKFMAMLESEEGQAAAAADGVKRDTMVLLVETK